MRYKSKLSGGLQVFAVAGTNTVSFGIHADQAARSGLLGFAIERVDPAKNERYFIHGFKVFPSIVPQPDKDTYVTTYVHPIQSLVWDDFTAAPEHDYTYVFHPLAGTPKNLDRSRATVSIDIRTEPLWARLTMCSLIAGSPRARRTHAGLATCRRVTNRHSASVARR